jgi:hypothetical protein
VTEGVTRFGVTAGMELDTTLAGGEDKPKRVSICVVFVGLVAADGVRVWGATDTESFKRSPWLCMGGLLSCLLPGGGGSRGAVVIVAGDEARLPESVV